MSVNIGKLNKGGLGSTSFGTNKKTTGLSSQAAKNLSGSSSATKSSVFQFGRAKRSNFVPGQHVRKDMSKYDFSGTRARLNAGVGATSRASYTSSIGNVGTTTYTVNNNTSYQKGMVVGQILNGTFGLLNQLGVFGGNNNGSSSLSDRIDSALSGLGNSSSGNVSSSISGSVSAMSSATDAASLREAIVGANGQLSSLKGMDSIYESQAANAEKLISDKGEYKEAETKAKSNVKNAESDLGTAKKQFEGTKAGRNTVLGQINQLDSKYGEAVNKYTQAHDARVSADSKYEQSKGVTSQCQTNYNNAKATYESTPDKIQDANGNMVDNPAKKQAETVMKQAEERLNQAKKAEEEAKTAAEKAKTAEDEALKNKDALKEQLGDKKAEAEKLEQQLNKQQTLVDKKNEDVSVKEKEYNIAKENEALVESKISVAQEAIDLNKQHKANVRDLTKAIESETKRLNSLESKAEKQDKKATKNFDSAIDKYNKQDANKNGVIDDNETSRFKTNSINRKNAKGNEAVDKRNTLDSNYDFTKWKNEVLMKQTPVVIDGEQYRKGTAPNGQEVYYRGNMPIDEDTYKKAVGVSS